MTTHIRRPEWEPVALCMSVDIPFVYAARSAKLPTPYADGGWCPACLAWHELVDPPKKDIAKDRRSQHKEQGGIQGMNIVHVQRADTGKRLCGAQSGSSMYKEPDESVTIIYDGYAWCPLCIEDHLWGGANQYETAWKQAVAVLADGSASARYSREQGPSAASQARDVLNPDNIRRVDRKQPILNDED